MTEPTASVDSVYDTVPLPLGNTRYIRVIKIRSDTTDKSLKCEICVLDIHSGTLVRDCKVSEQVAFSVDTGDRERVEYNALSYTWGHSYATRTIKLNNTPFTIRSNLWDFLHQAKERGHTGYLWIDAICIDQKKIRERNHQVGIMGEIYSRAERVIVWLGDGQGEILMDLNTVFNASPIVHQLQQYTTAIQRFCCLPYWSRAWIVQEYYLAKRKEIWYGHLRIEPAKMYETIRIWHAALPQMARGAPAANMLFAQEFHKTSWSIPGEGYVKFALFLRLSRLFVRLECADRRDRLYAQLSLLSPDERREIGISPDYSRSATDLFLDVVTQLKDAVRSAEEDYHLVIALRCYGRMLRPDLQQREVQSAIIGLRSSVPQDGSGIWFTPVDHHCDGSSEPIPTFVAHGCPRCLKRPVISYDIDDRASPETDVLFSKGDWRRWVKALLSSEDVLDRQHGIALLKDVEFDLGVVKWQHALNIEASYNGGVYGDSGSILREIAEDRKQRPHLYSRLL